MEEMKKNEVKKDLRSYATLINVYGSIEKDFDMVEDYITEMIVNNMLVETLDPNNKLYKQKLLK